MNQPLIIVHWPALFVAVIAAFAFGGVWYGPLLGKTWAGLMGMDFSKKPEAAVMKRAFACQFVGTFLTAYVITFSLNVWRPSAWNLGADGPNYLYGFYCGFFTWLGFYVPLQLGKVSWEGRPWKLFFINAAHDFLNLQIIAQIIAHWH